MSELTPLHESVRSRFVAAFGEPHRTLGRDWQWSMRPLSYVAAVNVLVNGGRDVPAVWIFDPHDPSDGVTSVSIDSEAEIGPLIAKIEHRVRHAGIAR
jgi:hypothetical protein